MAAGVATSVFAPSFGGLYKKEQELEGETVPGFSSARTASCLENGLDFRRHGSEWKQYGLCEFTV